jgi:hypothetical protein
MCKDVVPVLVWREVPDKREQTKLMVNNKKNGVVLPEPSESLVARYMSSVPYRFLSWGLALGGIPWAVNGKVRAARRVRTDIGKYISLAPVSDILINGKI